MLRIKLLGSLTISRASGPALVLAKKAQALIAYLAAAESQSANREQLAPLLWDKSGEQQARQSLRQCLANMRAEGPEATRALSIEGNTIRLASADVDLVHFRILAGSSVLADLEQAAALCQGQLLEGLSVSSDAFERWLSDERVRLLDSMDRLFVRIRTMQAERGDLGAAITTARRLVALDPLREEHHRVLIGMLAANGERAAALRHYRSLADLLAKELGSNPDKATKELARSLSLGAELEPLQTAHTLALVPSTSAPSENAAERLEESRIALTSPPDDQQARHLLAVLVADAVGYSRLMALNENMTFRAMKNIETTILAPSVATNRGRIVKGTGDGFIAVFESATDAVACAIAIQNALNVRNETQDGKGLQFRFGINMGDVIESEGDIFGDVVNVAARLQANADAGCIDVSRAIRDAVQGKLDVVFVNRGEVRVKNIPDPVATFRAIITDELERLPKSLFSSRELQVIAAGLMVVTFWLAMVMLQWFFDKPMSRDEITAALVGKRLNNWVIYSDGTLLVDTAVKSKATYTIDDGQICVRFERSGALCTRIFRGIFENYMLLRNGSRVTFSPTGGETPKSDIERDFVGRSFNRRFHLSHDGTARMREGFSRKYRISDGNLCLERTNEWTCEKISMEKGLYYITGKSGSKTPVYFDDLPWFETLPVPMLLPR